LLGIIAEVLFQIIKVHMCTTPFRNRTSAQLALLHNYNNFQSQTKFVAGLKTKNFSIGLQTAQPKKKKKVLRKEILRNEMQE
jgi:hypothetical protein